MRYLILLMLATSRPTPSAEPKRQETFFSAAALHSLDCVEAWEQLCSPPYVGANGELLGPIVTLVRDQVVVSPDYGPEEFQFHVESRSGAALHLILKSCRGAESCTAMGSAARLDLKDKGRAVYVGPDPRLLMKGQVGVIRLELVSAVEYGSKLAALVKLYVPGGKCEGLSGYHPTGRGECLKPPQTPARR